MLNPKQLEAFAMLASKRLAKRLYCAAQRIKVNDRQEYRYLLPNERKSVICQTQYRTGLNRGEWLGIGHDAVHQCVASHIIRVTDQL